MNFKQKYNSYIYTEAIKSRIEMEGLYFIFKRLKIYIYQQDSKASTDIFLKSYESLVLTLSPHSGSGSLAGRAVEVGIATDYKPYSGQVGSRYGRSGWAGLSPSRLAPTTRGHKGSIYSW